MTPEKFSQLGVGDIVVSDNGVNYIVTQKWGRSAVVTRSQFISESTAEKWDLTQIASHVDNDYRNDATEVQRLSRIAREKEIRANAQAAAYSTARFWLAMLCVAAALVLFVVKAIYYR